MEVPTKDGAAKTLVPQNPNLAKLHAGFLFIEVLRRRDALLKKHPEARVISLGPGDTTEPIHSCICSAMELKTRALSTQNGYTGYGPDVGELPLRAAIATKLYPGLNVKETEIFVSDGAKSDIARLQLLFGPLVSVAIQDPSFPVYADVSVIAGQTGSFLSHSQQYGNIEYMKCTPENDFFPNLSSVSRKDVIFFCSPNNPTGVAATRAQLEELVAFAMKNGSIIVFDSAYSAYISDDSPKSIYEIPGARKVAIEISSFSKYAGFSGVRLGWSVVPDELLYSNGLPVINDFARLICTCFNGASNIAQAGGLACLSTDGWDAVKEMVGFYKKNAQMLLEAFTSLGFGTYGGVNAPYVWVQFPGQNSWDVFEEILEKAHVVTIPGSGFGPAGEGFLRISAFCHREDVLEAIKRLRALYQPKNVEGQARLKAEDPKHL